MRALVTGGTGRVARAIVERLQVDGRPWWVSAAAKAAQAMLTRALARAFAPDVRVCGVAPGPVAVAADQADRRAAETLLQCVGSPEGVAEDAAYLARAAFVTGTTLVIDGGRLLQTGRGRDA